MFQVVRRLLRLFYLSAGLPSLQPSPHSQNEPESRDAFMGTFRVREQQSPTCPAKYQA